jgi:hypothetical protein
MVEYSNSLAKQYAEEHYRFLTESNPRFLKNLQQSGSLEHHLHSTGEDAAQMHEAIMSQGSQSKEMQDMPYPQKDKALRGLLQATQELVRSDLIHQPVHG